MAYGDGGYGDGLYGGQEVVVSGDTGNASYVSCQPWISSDLLCCEGVTAEADCEGVEALPVYMFTDNEYIQAVSNILFNLTAQRFPGLCTITTRPCFHGCSRHPCICGGSYDVIKLPTDYRVWSVTEVTIDGVVVPASSYEIVGRNDLVRVDCERWPHGNSLVATDCGCGHVVEVTFITGAEPPIELRMAAADLVCELKKACSGEKCALPEAVTGITRRGVKMDFNKVGQTLSTGKTGIKSVDYALDVWGASRRGGRFADPLDLARGY